MLGVMSIKDKYELSNYNYKDMVIRSLVSTGNNARMKNVIQKAKRKDEVTMVYLGASITMLRADKSYDCYATSSFQYFKERFCASENIKYVNSGMNGTNSTMGLIRVERDVLKYQPDIVFIEFAVNDSKDSVNREIFESLVLRILQSESQPAVVLVFMLSDSNYTCQGHMQAIGEHYNLPMISLGDAIIPEFDANRMKWSDYSDDNIHPNEAGNALITDFINNLFETFELQKPDKIVPLPESPFFGDSYVNMKMLDAGNLIVKSLGSFKRLPTIKEFSNGWVHSKNAGKDSLVFRLNCKNLFVVYREINDISEGSAHIYVDGIKKCTMSGYRTFAWDNPVALFVFQEETVREHLIEVKMAQGDEQKEFSLLAFGYSD